MISNETRKSWQVKADAVMKAAKEGKIRLNDWEKSFMQNVTIRLAACDDLTMQQSISLSGIYSRIK